MTLIEIFEKFDLPIALIIVLLAGIVGLFYILWRSSETREAKLSSQLIAAQVRTDALVAAAQLQATDNNERFITALKDQNNVTKAIADSLAPVKASTDLIPALKSEQALMARDVNFMLAYLKDRREK